MTIILLGSFLYTRQPDFRHQIGHFHPCSHLHPLLGHSAICHHILSFSSGNGTLSRAAECELGLAFRGVTSGFYCGFKPPHTNFLATLFPTRFYNRAPCFQMLCRYQMLCFLAEMGRWSKPNLTDVGCYLLGEVISDGFSPTLMPTSGEVAVLGQLAVQGRASHLCSKLRPASEASAVR